MSMALTLERYLDAKSVKYDVIAHEPTNSSIETAKTCRIPGDCLAKAVLLRDEVGYALAVLPASHHIRLAELRRQFGDDVSLASEHEVAELFQDCARDAIPAVASVTASTWLSMPALMNSWTSISKAEITRPSST
jgi:Ala-tRNA(Pro) deacylase